MYHELILVRMRRCCLRRIAVAVDDAVARYYQKELRSVRDPLLGAYGKGFDTGLSGRGRVPGFLGLLVVFLGLPDGFPTLPAPFQGLCSCGGVSVDRNLLAGCFEDDSITFGETNLRFRGFCCVPGPPLAMRAVFKKPQL